MTRTYQPMWPIGVLDLPLLERLDLRGTGIRTLPPQMFEAGNERLWKGLSLDWSQFAPEDFRQAYEYVTRHPEHLLDREEMVRDYCKGGLLRLLNPGSVVGDLTLRTRQSDTLLQAFLERWPDASARFEAIEALSAQYQSLAQPLKVWSVGGEPRVEFMHRYNVVSSLEACWYNGVIQRYGLTGSVSTLDLSSVALSELPPLPEQGFEHVQVLTLKGLRVPEQQLGGFFNRFSGLQTLNLSDCALTQLPMSSRPWAALEHLDLSYNPLNSLDVSTMPSLKALGLSHCTLQTWPVGVESLTDLTWLDLRHTQLVSLPEAALASDTVMFSANLYDTPLNEATRTALAAALRRVEQARGVSTGTLERFALDVVPEQFPPAETALSISRQLLPLPAPVTLESTLEQRLARLMPTLPEHELQAWVARMRSEGLADDVLNTRLNGWHQQFDALTRRLNDWLFMREAHGTQWAVSSQSRGQAALRIIECWRAGLRAVDGVEGILSLDGLQLGDLPEPPTRFDHVSTLNLAGARISEDGSNGFLRAFGQLRVLNLNSNLLVELPEAVNGMSHLERLELAGNGFSDPQPLLDSLQELTQLQSLDLSQNQLRTFSMSQLPRLQSLNLSGNQLANWPEGTLQSSTLRTLNLSNNSIETIPAAALDGTHDALMEGVDLSDNFELPETSLEQLRRYADRLGRSRVLGTGINTWPPGVFDQPRGRTFNLDLSANVLEIIPQVEPGSDAAEIIARTTISLTPEYISAQNLELVRNYRTSVGLDPNRRFPARGMLDSINWRAGLDDEQWQAKTDVWEALEDEIGAEPFFNELRKLAESADAQTGNEAGRVDLTRKVWEMVEAAAANADLRRKLFSMAEAPTTCVDAGAQLFNAMGLEVLIDQAYDLIAVDLIEARLLELAQGKSRLDELGHIARARIGELVNQGRKFPEYDAHGRRITHRDDLGNALVDIDEVEIHMIYPTRLAEPLELPWQSREMMFQEPDVNDQMIEDARKRVLALEEGPLLQQQIIEQPFWTDFVQRAHPELFEDFRRRAEALLDLEETSPGSYDAGLPSIVADERTLIVKLTSEAMQRAKLQRTEIPFHLVQGNGELPQNRK
ncbi:NEL-type E3 ubiquitin ligase domain-containing protein [Pseudomonas costantinii]|uniref:NEL-type E3 ubiquitin ligase domain-containing protein n=1 Tax=Pseudomonas costantinii TaxID=168469 RepID=UPI0015A3D306|nr:NEL-type E3 ubiquitin ligase domain-containing protein [Pseudomonas costantinii]NVZ67643.1 leucine-rich repeat domain-containing protein [Pseudomonas costantinii]